MKETISAKTIWNEACKSGLVLGLIPVAYALVNELTAGLSSQSALGAMCISVFRFAFWAGKFALCIWAMAYFMKRLAAKYEGVTNRDTRRFGTCTALLSALIVAAASLAMLIINPESTSEAISEVTAQLGASGLDSNQLSTLDSMMSHLPSLTFFSTLIYCFLFGWILSAILSRNIPSRNPFEQA